MLKDELRALPGILERVDTATKLIALTQLVVLVGLVAIIQFLPSTHRIYAFGGALLLLFADLLCLRFMPWTSQDHKQPDDSQDHKRPKPDDIRNVIKLKNKLMEGRFLPQLIIAISRSGLAVAGRLAVELGAKDEELGEKEFLPVVSLSPRNPSEGWGFDNAFNDISFSRKDFHPNTSGTIGLLIVDDISLSGRTLDDARTYVERSIDRSDFVVKTAAIYCELSRSRRTQPDFVAEYVTEKIENTYGQIE